MFFFFCFVGMQACILYAMRGTRPAGSVCKDHFFPIVFFLIMYLIIHKCSGNSLGLLITLDLIVVVEEPRVLPFTSGCNCPFKKSIVTLISL